MDRGRYLRESAARPFVNKSARRARTAGAAYAASLRAALRASLGSAGEIIARAQFAAADAGQAVDGGVLRWFDDGGGLPVNGFGRGYAVRRGGAEGDEAATR